MAQQLDIFPDHQPIERSSMNSWEDERFVAAVKATGRKKPDWARKETYNDVMAVVKEHCGAYGQGVEYAYTMVHGAPPSRSGAGG